MKVVVAEKAGYCFGINNAMKMIEETFEAYPNTPITCLGDISHNKQEMARLEARGIRKVESLDEVTEGVLVIRSHGVGREVLDHAKQKGLIIVNATCPFVRAMQRKVGDYYDKGYQIVIVGNANHPEVEGATGWCDHKAVVIGSLEEVDRMDHYEKICVVAQTTMIASKFQKITEALKDKADEIVIFNTICSATAERQAAAAETAKGVEYMIVVGGYHSSNTQKLLEVCQAHCKNTCHIETAGELNPTEIKKYKVVGITAGASTPDWIVKEVTESMEEVKVVQDQEVVKEEVVEENFDFAAAIEDTMPQVRKNRPLEGEVIEVSADEVILKIGYKSDAVITKSDYTWKRDDDLTELVKIGDKITGIVTDLNDGSGRVKMSKIKFENQRVQTQLSEAFDAQEIIEGTVKSVSGSGLIVDIGFSDIFMPASQYHVRFVKDLNALVGEKVRGKIIDYDPRRRRAIFSQKVVLEKEFKERQEKIRAAKEARFNELEAGQTVTGKVKTITEFGIFVDLNGIDGFVHRSDLTWERANNPKDVVTKGQEIEAKIISKNEEDMKIKLSVKALIARPWDNFVANYKEGDEVEVTITNVLEFGAFAKIMDNVEGLIHVSEISYERVEKVSDALKTGDVVKVKIIGINPEKEKISLSIKATLEAPERPARRKKRAENAEGEKPAREDRPKKRQPKNANTTVYEDNVSFSLGDAFGGLLEGLNLDEE